MRGANDPLLAWSAATVEDRRVAMRRAYSSATSGMGPQADAVLMN